MGCVPYAVFGSARVYLEVRPVVARRMGMSTELQALWSRRTMLTRVPAELAGTRSRRPVADKHELQEAIGTSEGRGVGNGACKAARTSSARSWTPLQAVVSLGTPSVTLPLARVEGKRRDNDRPYTTTPSRTVPASFLRHAPLVPEALSLRSLLTKPEPRSLEHFEPSRTR